MSTHFIPPRGERQIRMDQVEGQVRESLRAFFTKRGGAKVLEEATKGVMMAIKSNLSLPKEPTKGATVMTEKASTERGDRGTYLGKPQSL